MRNQSIHIFSGTATFSASASAGLLLFLAVASFTGWISPIWWGGEALFPMLAGFITIIAGTVPFYALTRTLLAKCHSNCTVGATSLVGAVFGAALIPLVFFVSALMGLIISGRAYEYPLMLVIIATGVSGLLGIFLGVALVCLLSIEQHEQ